MKNKKSLKIAVLVFALTFAVGAAFAATSGMLAFGGTVRINSTTVGPDPVLSVEFVSAEARVNPPSLSPSVLEASAEVVVNADGRQTLSFDLNFPDGLRVPTTGTPVFIEFTLENTGDTAALITGIQQTGGPGFNVLGQTYDFILEPGQRTDRVMSLSATDLRQYLGTYTNTTPSTPNIFVNISFNLNYMPAPIPPGDAPSVPDYSDGLAALEALLREEVELGSIWD